MAKRVPKRILSPWVRFVPPDEKCADDTIAFFEVANLVREAQQRKRLEALRKKNEVIRRSLRKLASPELSPDANEIIARLIKDTEIPPEGRFKVDFELASLPTEELSVHLGDLLLELRQRALDGDQKAVEEVVNIAHSTTEETMAFEMLFPAEIKTLARRSPSWPVLRKDDRDNLQHLNQRLERLEVGQGLTHFQCKFRKMRGADQNYPSREWGKRVIRAIEETRFRLIYCSHHQIFDVAIAEKFNLDLADAPAWVRNLPSSSFTAKSLDEWLPLVREVIREDAPDFHTHSDWSNQRRTLEAGGRDARGTLQNAVLDDICSALQGLAV